MHTLLYHYLLDGSNEEALLNANYPLPDGTTFAHIELAQALRANKEHPLAPEDALANRIKLIYLALNVDTPPDKAAQDAFYAVKKIFNKIKKKSDEDKRAIASCYHQIANSFFGFYDLDSAVFYYRKSIRHIQQINNKTDCHYRDHAKACASLAATFIELSKLNDDRDKIIQVDLYFEQAITAYKKIKALTPDDRSTLAKFHILVGNCHDSHFNGLTDDLSFISYFYQLAIDEVLHAKTITEQLVTALCDAFARTKNNYYETGIEYYFWSFAEMSLTEDITDQHKLMSKFSSLFSNLTGNKLLPEEKRTYTLLTVNLIKLLVIAFDHHVLPTNALKDFLSNSKQSFNEAIQTLQAQQVAKLSTIAKNEHLAPHIENAIAELTRQLPDQGDQINLLTEKIALNVHDKKPPRSDADIRNELTTLSNESIWLFNENRPAESVDHLKHSLFLYDQLASLTNDDLAEMSDAELSIGYFYHYSTETNHNNSHAIKHYSNAARLRQKINAKTNEDWHFIFDTQNHTISAIVSEPHAISIFDAKTTISTLGYDALNALVHMGQHTESDMSKFLLTLDKITQFLPDNHLSKHFFLIAAKCFLIDLQAHLGNFNAVHHLSKFTAIIKDGTNHHWRSLKAPLANLFSLVLKIQPTNKLYDYLKNNLDTVNELIQSLMTTNESKPIHGNKSFDARALRQLEKLEQQAEHQTAKLTQLKQAHSKAVATTVSSNPSAFFNTNTEELDLRGMKRASETDMLTLEQESNPFFSPKQQKSND